MVSPPALAPDPLLKQQQQQAKAQQLAAVQQGVSDDTWNLLRIFGANQAMAGSGMSSPLAGLVGKS